MRPTVCVSFLLRAATAPRLVVQNDLLIEAIQLERQPELALGFGDAGTALPGHVEVVLQASKKIASFAKEQAQARQTGGQSHV